jgi:putative component of membrane protein insertase Oxa1/YidC/SpoIIIJ protein YidD
MAQAIIKYGVIRGVGLGCWRILRCNPFSHGGDDPLP